MQIVIHGRNDTRLLHNLALVLIDSLQTLRTIHDGRSRFKAAFSLLLDGNMTAIDLDDQGLRRRRTCFLRRDLLLLLGEVCPHCICYTFHLGMVIDAPVVTIPLLQIPLRFSVAIQGPVFAL